MEDREEINESMNVKRATKRGGGSGGKGKGEAVVVVVVPAKPGVREWWREVRQVDGLVDLKLLDEEVRTRVPERLMLCKTATQNQGGMMRAAGKKAGQKP